MWPFKKKVESDRLKRLRETSDAVRSKLENEAAQEMLREMHTWMSKVAEAGKSRTRLNTKNSDVVCDIVVKALRAEGFKARHYEYEDLGLKTHKTVEVEW